MALPSLADISRFLCEAHERGWPRNVVRRTDADFSDFEQTSFNRKEWRYLDVWAGATTDIGLQTIFYRSHPVWGCAYRGGIMDRRFLSPDNNPVFAFLISALRQRDRAPLPIRGPHKYEAGAWSYSFESCGALDSFVAKERITLHRTRIYERMFIGGRQGDRVGYGGSLRAAYSLAGFS